MHLAACRRYSAACSLPAMSGPGKRKIHADPGNDTPWHLFPPYCQARTNPGLARYFRADEIVEKVVLR